MVYVMPENGGKKQKKDLTQIGIDRLGSLVAALNKARQEARELDVHIKDVERQIKEAMGDAEEGTVRGVPVVQYTVTERLAYAKFAEENPDIAAEFTIMKPMPVLDDTALRASKHADLLNRYRIRTFKVL